MDKRQVQRQQRGTSKVGDLSTAAVDQTEAARVVGGDAKKPTPTTKPATYLTITLENTMISG